MVKKKEIKGTIPKLKGFAKQKAKFKRILRKTPKSTLDLRQREIPEPIGSKFFKAEKIRNTNFLFN